MTLHRGAGRTCRLCGKPLTDSTSRLFGIGPDCRKGMTDAQLRASIQVRKQEDDPFHLPEQRGPSAQAQLNNRNARAAVDVEQVQLCRHENTIGACGDCRREADPNRAAERILAEVMAMTHAERRAERIAYQQARPILTPAAKPAPKPRRRPTPPAIETVEPTQMELL